MTKKKTIKVAVEELDEKVMFLHQHLGDGTLGDTKFDVDVVIPDYSFVVKVGGKRYKVSSQAIISAVVDLHDAKK